MFFHISTNPLPEVGQSFDCEVWETNKTHASMRGTVLAIEGRWYTLRFGGQIIKMLDTELLGKDLVLLTKEMAL